MSLGRHQPTAFPLAHQARSFDQDINAWNVSQATDMRQFFCRASAFNQPLGAWQVGRVRNMEQMFNELGDFDQDLNAWECADRHSNLLDRLMLCLTPCLFRALSVWDKSRRRSRCSARCGATSPEPRT